jgi:hypothetical protein
MTPRSRQPSRASNRPRSTRRSGRSSARATLYVALVSPVSGGLTRWHAAAWWSSPKSRGSSRRQTSMTWEAAGVEAAAGRWVARARHVAAHHLARAPAAGPGHWDRCHQPLGIAALRIGSRPRSAPDRRPRRPRPRARRRPPCPSRRGGSDAGCPACRSISCATSPACLAAGAEPLYLVARHAATMVRRLWSSEGPGTRNEHRRRRVFSG